MATKKKLDKKDHAGMSKAAVVVKGVGTLILMAVPLIPGLKHLKGILPTKKS